MYFSAVLAKILSTIQEYRPRSHADCFENRQSDRITGRIITVDCEFEVFYFHLYLTSSVGMNVKNRILVFTLQQQNKISIYLMISRMHDRSFAFNSKKETT